jgi:diadenosine tetraphosphate (Ap4A) HIT family hydrolase
LAHNALPSIGASAQAHHVFPVKFKNKFENKFGIKIDDAENGVWLDCHKHLSGAWKYNKEWEEFFRKNPDASKDDVMEFARKLMVETYGETVNF